MTLSLMLPVVGVWPVLAPKMFLDELDCRRPSYWIDTQGFAGKTGDEFQHRCIVDGVFQGLAPGERAVIGDQHGRMVQRVQAVESLDDDAASVQLVIGFDFVRQQLPRARDVAAPIIGVRRAKSRKLSAGLRPGGGVKAMGVDDAADMLKSAIENQMGWRIGAWREPAFDNFAGREGEDDHLPGLELVVRHAGGLADDQRSPAIDGTGIAPGL